MKPQECPPIPTYLLSLRAASLAVLGIEPAHYEESIARFADGTLQRKKWQIDIRRRVAKHMRATYKQLARADIAEAMGLGDQHHSTIFYLILGGPKAPSATYRAKGAAA